MQSVKYRITTLAPILMSRTSGDRNTVSTTNYFSGTTLQGVFAGLFFKNGGNENDFYKYFFEGNLNFLNAYLCPINDENRYYPVPISVQKEKNGNSIYDLLFFENDENIQTLSLNSNNDKYGILNDGAFSIAEVSKSLNFHHERDDDKGTTKEGAIFNYESINKNQTFEGYITGNEAEIEQVKRLIPSDNIFYIGRSKNSQYGKVKFEIISDVTDVSEAKNKIEINEGKISLTFLSDVIIYNEQGYTSRNVDDLKNMLSNTFPEVVIEKSFIKTGITENYISVWKLKKPADACFLAGSCFLLSGFKNSDITNLKKLQSCGIGLRKSEGFGRIVFGLQDSENLTETTPLQPNTEISVIPDLTKKIFFSSIDEFIMKTVRIQAFSDEKAFSRNNKLKNKLSGSLVSRLEAFMEISETQTDFTDKLNKLKKEAADKLKDLTFDKKSFFDYLFKNPEEIDKIIDNKNHKSLNNAISRFGYNRNGNLNKLYKEYYLTFFQALRKTLKREGV
jgi:CRISPR-associated protein Csx10